MEVLSVKLKKKYQNLIDDWLARSEFFNTGDVFDKPLEFDVDILDLQISKMVKKVTINYYYLSVTLTI